MALLRALFLVLAAVLVVPILVPVILYHALVGGLLTVAAWIAWGTRGRDVLVVTSASPVWSKYFAEEIIRPLGERAVVLDWSTRSTWRPSLATWLFDFFGGQRAFCPMVVVLRPLRRPRTLRFHEAFKAWKHGKPAGVEELTREMWGLLG